ncbi:MAG: SAM-dependent methyltransferase [Erythrobacter sp.]
MKVLAVLIFVPLQIVWFPLTILGSMIVGYRQLVISSRLGVSQTAVEIINGRWAMDAFGLRRDAAARKLADAIPNNSVFGLWLALFPIWIVSKLFRMPFLYPTIPSPENAKLTNLVPSRTVEFDALISTNAESCAQLVILGAGLDTRAYGPLKQSGLAIYELDEPLTQAHKTAALARAQIDAGHVQFVEVDFADRNWSDALLATDFDREKATIFLWEGVTLYLPEDAVKATIASLKNIAPAGSVVLTDLYSQRFVKFARGKAIGWSLEMTGETMNFGLDLAYDSDDTLKRFADGNDVGLGHHQCLGGANKNGPFVAIAEFRL